MAPNPYDNLLMPDTLSLPPLTSLTHASTIGCETSWTPYLASVALEQEKRKKQAAQANRVLRNCCKAIWGHGDYLAPENEDAVSDSEGAWGFSIVEFGPQGCGDAGEETGVVREAFTGIWEWGVRGTAMQWRFARLLFTGWKVARMIGAAGGRDRVDQWMVANFERLAQRDWEWAWEQYGYEIVDEEVDDGMDEVIDQDLPWSKPIPFPAQQGRKRESSQELVDKLTKTHGQARKA